MILIFFFAWTYEKLLACVYLFSFFFSGSDLIFDFDPDLIRDCAKALSPEKVCLFLISRDFTNECDQVEQWFKTNYKGDNYMIYHPIWILLKSYI